MFIDPDILFAWGAVTKKYAKGEFVFHEGEHARFFYQILSGTIKVFNTNADGREFTQAEFKSGDCFGEPPLFIDESYPSTAVSCEETVVIKISKEKVLDILDEYPSLQKKLIIILSRRIFNKSITASEVINNNPESRIIAFLNAYKKKISDEKNEVEVPYTRQEIANYTGLRVETVIRTLTKMKSKNLVKIIKRKLIY